MKQKLLFSVVFATLIITGSAIAEGWSPVQDEGADQDETASSLSSLQAQMSQLAASNSAVSSAYAAQAAAVTAQISLIQAQQALEANRIGSISNTSLSNEVEAGSISSAAEASLMASLAIQQAGEKVAAKIAAVCGSGASDKCHAIYILGSDADSNGAVTTEYKARLNKANVALKHAEGSFAAVHGCAVPAGSGSSSGSSGVHTYSEVAFGTPQQNGVGLILDTLTNLGSHFAGSYKYNAYSVTTNEDDFENAVTGALVDNNRKVYISGAIYDTGIQYFNNEMALYEERYLNIINDEVICKMALTKIDAKSPLVQIYTGVLTDLSSAKTEFYDNFFSWLVTAPAGGKPPLVQVVQREKLEADVQGASILTLSGNAVAAIYTKKSLWSFFGGPQLYASGGASVRYRLTKPDGELLASGIVPVDSGYRSIKQVQKLFSASSQ